MDVSLDRRCAHEGFTQTGQALVGVNAHPDDVGELAEPDSFYVGDLQGLAS